MKYFFNKQDIKKKAYGLLSGSLKSRLKEKIMKNVFSILIFALITALMVSSVHAYEMVSPRPGEGPVQIAERLGISPKKFIKLNLQLGNFKYPRRVSLIYTWQKFAIPETNKERETDLVKEDKLVEIPAVKAHYPFVETSHEDGISTNIEKMETYGWVKQNDNILSKGIKVAIIFVLFSVPIILFRTSKKEDAEIKQIREYMNCTAEKEGGDLNPPLLLLGDTIGGYPIDWGSISDKKEIFFVGRCRTTGNMSVVHGSSEYQSSHKGVRGLIEIQQFIKGVYGYTGMENIQFDIPIDYAERYDSIKQEIKDMQDFNSG